MQVWATVTIFYYDYKNMNPKPDLEKNSHDPDVRETSKYNYFNRFYGSLTGISLKFNFCQQFLYRWTYAHVFGERLFFTTQFNWTNLSIYVGLKYI